MSNINDNKLNGANYAANEEYKSEQIKHDYEFTEIELQKINLQIGDTLMVTVKNDYIDAQSIQNLRAQFKRVFPNNEIFVFAMDSNADIKFAAVSQPEAIDKPQPLSYCSDCSCGKREAAENNTLGSSEEYSCKGR